MTLRLGVYSAPVDTTSPGSAPTGRDFLDFARAAESMGVDSIWTPEYWGIDAFTPLAAIAAVTDTIRLGTAIAQIDARTPAMLAMTAMGVQAVSDGRLLLGIGSSGPQVMEGWHGTDFARPLRRTRETIEIIRIAMSGERLSYDGEMYRLPRPGSQGRALRSASSVGEVPIYVASLGPANLRLTGELADGWIGNSFFTESAEVFFDEIAAGAAAADRSMADLDLTVSVGAEFTEQTDDVEAVGRRHARGYAFTFGAMGSGSTNFYNDAFARQGYADDVGEVQRLWLAGDREAAADRVPAAIGLRTNLIGPRDVVRDRLREYRDCGVTTLRVSPGGADMGEHLATLETLVELVSEVNAEISTDG